MADNYFSTKKFKDNLRRYEETVEAGASLYMDCDELVDIGEYYHDIGKLDEAHRALDYALQLFPDATAPYALLARMALMDSDDADAAELMAGQIADKTDIEYYLLRAEIMLFREQVDEADEYLEEKMQDIDEIDLDDYYLDVATLFADYNYMKEAEDWLSMSCETDLDDYKELYGRIELSKGNVKESEKVFLDLIDKDAFSAVYWDNLAASQFALSKMEDAMQSCDFSIAIDPNGSFAHYQKALVLAAIGNINDALACFKRYNTLEPRNIDGAYSIASCLFTLKRYQEALTWMEKAEHIMIEVGDDFHQYDIYKNMVLLHAILGHKDLAMQYIDKLNDTNEDNKCEAMVLRGHVALMKKDAMRATKYFRKAINMSHANPNIMLDIALSFYDCNYLNDAHQILKVLTEAKYSSNIGYGYYALCCHDLGYREEFRRAVEQAVKVNPEEAKEALATLFPAGMRPEEYGSYLSATTNQLNG